MHFHSNSRALRIDREMREREAERLGVPVEEIEARNNKKSLIVLAVLFVIISAFFVFDIANHDVEVKVDYASVLGTYELNSDDASNNKDIVERYSIPEKLALTDDGSVSFSASKPSIIGNTSLYIEGNDFRTRNYTGTYEMRGDELIRHVITGASKHKHDYEFRYTRVPKVE